MKLKSLTIITLILAVANPTGGLVLSPELETIKPPYGIRYILPETIYPAKLIEYEPEPDYSDWSIEDTRRLVEEYNLPAEMVRIASCESEHKLDAVSPTRDYGLFQINKKWWLKELQRLEIIEELEDLFNPHNNAQAAKHIYGIQGLDAWVCWDILRSK